MAIERHRLTLSLLAVVAWGFVTAFPLLLPHPLVPINEAVADGIAFNVLFAAVVLLGIAGGLKWTDLGFNAPRSWKSLWLLWLPGLYLVLFYGIDIMVGFPPMPTVAILFVNTLLVGISEELAFRGVMYRGLRTRLGMWPSVIITSVAFGAIHVLNTLATGNLMIAAAQALAATMTGVMLMAVVIRTGSIIPGIVLHALWDFGSIVAALAAAGQVDAAAAGGAAIPDIPALAYLAPALLILPNLLYGLFLLRKRRTADIEPPVRLSAVSVAQG